MFFKIRPTLQSGIASPAPQPLSEPSVPPAVSPPQPPKTPNGTPAAIAKLSDLDRKLTEVIKRLGRIEANLIDIREARMRGEPEIR